MRASERAYVAMRDAIFDGDIAPGTVLGEVEQAARIGVSRTPVREALRRLLAERLVTERSPRTLVVSGLDADRIRNLYELREALESRAAAFAAERRDGEVFRDLRARFDDVPELLRGGSAGVEASFALIAELDAAIDDAVGNDDFRQALASVRLHSARIRRLAKHNPERLREAATEHVLVIDAIVAGDASLASHATHVHLHRSLQNALAAIERTETNRGVFADPNDQVR
ncbi:MAG: GntR family transcriptional regulator [Pseudoclavibacter sp.]